MSEKLSLIVFNLVSLFLLSFARAENVKRFAEKVYQLTLKSDYSEYSKLFHPKCEANEFTPNHGGTYLDSILAALLKRAMGASLPPTTLKAQAIEQWKTCADKACEDWFSVSE